MHKGLAFGNNASTLIMHILEDLLIGHNWDEVNKGQHNLGRLANLCNHAIKLIKRTECIVQSVVQIISR